jgi:phosphatidylglycerol:prolipoprotein diacylglycerol transferase
MYPNLIPPIFGFQISSFGLLMALAFLLGGLLAARSFETAGLGRDAAWRLVTWAMLGGVAGSKLWYVAEVVSRTPQVSPWEPLLSRGGITWYGGLVGGAVFVLAVAWRRGLPLATVMNLSAPALALGQAIGRIGCLLVGDDYGRPTDVAWGLAFPEGVDPTTARVHPTQAYETLWLGASALWLWRRRSRSPFLFGEYLVLAGAGRLWIELLRTNPPALGPLTNAQVAALGCIALGAAAWTIRYARRSRALRRSSAA